MSTIEIRALRFDDWNRTHLAREHHEVSEEEARQVVASLAPLVWISYGGRPVFLGPTANGRMLVVVLDPEGDGVYLPCERSPGQPQGAGTLRPHTRSGRCAREPREPSGQHDAGHVGYERCG